MKRKVVFIALAGSALSVSAVASAEATVTAGEPHYAAAATQWQGAASSADQRLAIFTPTADPVRTTIDYEIWDYALKRILLNMGPSSGKGAPRTDAQLGTRIKYGPQSRYRLEGSMALFRFFDDDVKASFTEYRQDLERVAAEVDIASLPRNEQLAFWLNLHNVALMEQIALEWPVREPREIRIGGVPLDEARFINLRGIPVSLRDIREQIVYRHWRDPKVIYGFWRGEIGGPQLQSYAFTGDNVGSLLDVAATDFINSLRGTQKAGDTLAVSTLYAEAAPFYFPAFETDLRAHLGKYAEPRVAELLADTSGAKPSIYEHEIADLHGGARPPNSLFVSSEPGAAEGPLAVVGCSDQLGQAACDLVKQRKQKLQTMQRRGELNPRVFFSNISLPGDPPNKNAVE
ncbi:DUF547 domain-containing protein [Erythrobacter colymbi]|uniref:DUF547 domain-containing protein n=1 Tax=Erythrobacter colymbi TaxID=1161202 RepID=UPI000A3747A6|nr:DUF547 domain-containing protein [Erythrobacter colymbi]